MHKVVIHPKTVTIVMMSAAQEQNFISDSLFLTQRGAVTMTILTVPWYRTHSTGAKKNNNMHVAVPDWYSDMFTAIPALTNRLHVHCVLQSHTLTSRQVPLPNFPARFEGWGSGQKHPVPQCRVGSSESLTCVPVYKHALHPIINTKYFFK